MGCCASKASIGKRASKWKATGIVGLREVHLKAIPKDVIALGNVVRTLDASGNRLVELPLDIGFLVNLQRLLLAENILTRLPATLGRLGSLKIMALDKNRLTEIPDEVGLLVRLEKLSVSHNMLVALPQSLGSLRNLVLLDVCHNKLKELPASLASCSSLEELLASDNQIVELPQSLSGLSQLKTLVLSRNQVSKLPASILRDCALLQTLQLHENPFTMDMLEQMEGFEDFEARRRKKIDKRIGNNVITNSNLFDEGVDRK